MKTDQISVYRIRASRMSKCLRKTTHTHTHRFMQNHYYTLMSGKFLHIYFDTDFLSILFGLSVVVVMCTMLAHHLNEFRRTTIKTFIHKIFTAR